MTTRRHFMTARPVSSELVTSSTISFRKSFCRNSAEHHSLTAQSGDRRLNSARLVSVTCLRRLGSGGSRRLSSESPRPGPSRGQGRPAADPSASRPVQNRSETAPKNERRRHHGPGRQPRIAAVIALFTLSRSRINSIYPIITCVRHAI